MLIHLYAVEARRADAARACDARARAHLAVVPHGHAEAHAERDARVAALAARASVWHEEEATL